VVDFDELSAASLAFIMNLSIFRLFIYFSSNAAQSSGERIGS